ncbi:23S rRNA (uracil(1939)-C(5))-methyltransferase RlmD [Proteinivorax hydrogeniformans]|uniref:23S rRNA (Uracil(1939)-C(5))-methyltransferase RlmD n=1 Tax=Proteinivorax hydrogeniformans TaxID=1826727 RepID=A0AAU8HSA4_9FIRM
MSNLQKGNKYIVTIEDVTHQGEGVGKIDGFTVFVPQGLPEDKVEIEIISLKKNYGRGLIKEVLNPSPQRIKPNCPTYHECGGCNLQHTDYSYQLKLKRKLVKDALERIGGFNDPIIHHTLTAGDKKYRNKVQSPVGVVDGKTVAGFYKPKSHEIVPLENCHIQHPKSNQVLDRISKELHHLNIPTYNEKTGKGIVRHIVTKIGFNTDELMAILVVTKEDFHKKKELVDRIKSLEAVDTLVFNINSKKTNVVMGTKNLTMFGNGYITEQVSGIEYKISPLSFFQINPKGMEILYGKTLEYASLTGKEKVLDAYCGIGSISLFLAQQAKEVLGVEIVPQAIEDAKENAKINGIKNAHFKVGKAEEVIVDQAKKGDKYDVVVVDPPRKGCDEKLLDAIKEISPHKVVYVSCNPSTLARDLKYLCQEKKYELKQVQPVDMFPHSGHVECVVLMSRVKVNTMF